LTRLAGAHARRTFDEKRERVLRVPCWKKIRKIIEEIP
jgi:hypothetical protein